MSETTEAPATPAEVAPTPAATPAPESGGSGDNKPSSDAAPDKPEGDSKPKSEKEPWFVKRIAELTRDKNDRDRVLAQAEKELQRFRAAQHKPEGDKPAPPTGPDDADRIRQEAAKLREVEKFNEACNATYAAGKGAYDDWDSALNNYQALGGMPAPLVEAALETGEAHKVLYLLGKDPDEAQRIMGLSPARMGAALAKIAARPAPAPAVSKAPQPVRPIANGNANPPFDPEKASMAEYTAWRMKQIAAKEAR